MTSKKNIHLELYRILFTFIIIFHHYDMGLKGFINQGYIAVEFFFILSGFLLMQTVEHKKINISPYAYLLDRVKRLYPAYILAFLILGMLVFLINCIKGIEFDVKGIYIVLAEILIVNNLGIVESIATNNVTWYICSLLFSSFIVYATIKYNKKLAINIIFPVLILIIYGTICVNGIEHWSHIGPFYIPLLRGVGGVSVGVLTYKAFDNIVKKHIINKYAIGIIEIIDVLMISYIIFSSETIKEGYCIILFSILIICASINNMSSKSRFNGVINNWGNKCYYLYLNQILIIIIFEQMSKVLRYIGIPYFVQIIIFTILNIVYSILFEKILMICRKYCKKMNSRYKIIVTK